VGSSIGYQITQGNKKGKWQVYNQPIPVEQGIKITAKAVRYGYKTSTATTRVFH